MPTMDDIHNHLRELILKAVKHNNDNDGWDIRKSFDEQRDLIEDYEAAVILEAIKPEINKYIEAYLDAGASE
jgi:hypothetical protein